MPEEGIAMWPLRLFVIFIGAIAMMKSGGKLGLLKIYLLYSLFSIVFYVLGDYPISLYVNDVAFYLSPILMVFVGMNKADVSDNFLKYTISSILVMFVIGLYLYIVNPGWYQDAWVLQFNSRWYKADMNADFEYIKSNMRFSSFMLTSYATEYFGMFALPFTLCKMMKTTNRKWKLFYTAATLFILFVIVLSMQRAAIGASIAMLFVLGLYDFNHSHRAVKFYAYLFAVSFIMVSIFAATEDGARILDRFNDFTIDDTFSDARVSQNENLLNAWNNIILGNGLGTGGNEARKLGFPAVTDSQYVKILVEQGIVGLLMLLSFFIATGKRVLRNFKYLAAEGAYFAGVLVAMIGSNSLMFSLFILPFWYTIGRIWNDDYIQSKKINNNYI